MSVRKDKQEKQWADKNEWVLERKKWLSKKHENKHTLKMFFKLQGSQLCSNTVGESAYSKENKTTSKIPGPNEESQKYQILKCFKRNTEY